MSRALPVVLLLCTLAATLSAQAPAGAVEAVAALDTLAHGPVSVPEPSAEAVAYYRSGNVLWVLTTLWGLLVLALLLFSGLSARMAGLARRVAPNWFLTTVVFAVLFSVVTWIIDLPLSYYSGFVRPHAFDLSNQTLGKWMSDQAIGLLVGTAALALTLWIPYLLLRRSPRRWWLYTSLAAVPIIVLTMLVTPIWVQPLFNDFGPMRDEALEARILALAERAGIEDGRVFEVDKSVDTKTVNAYVTGFAGTKRIVLWDTLLERLDDDEVLFVMGHEMGHYVLRHTLWIILLASVLVLVSLYAVHRTAGWLIARHHERFGFDRLSDVASLPLLLLTIGLVGLVVAPVLNAATRYMEHEADRFGLEITRAGHPAATAFLKLQEENLAVPYPGPLYKLWRASHPPIGERVEFANTYRPWETGEPLRYRRLFGEAP